MRKVRQDELFTSQINLPRMILSFNKIQGEAYKNITFGRMLLAKVSLAIPCVQKIIRKCSWVKNIEGLLSKLLAYEQKEE